MSPTSLANRTPTKPQRKQFNDHRRPPLHRRLVSAYARLTPRVRLCVVLALLAFVYLCFTSGSSSKPTRDPTTNLQGKPAAHARSPRVEPTLTAVPFAPTQIRRMSAQLHFRKGIVQEVVVPLLKSQREEAEEVHFDNVWEEGEIEKVVVPLGGTLVVRDGKGRERRLVKGEDEECSAEACVGLVKVRLEQDVLLGLKQMSESSGSSFLPLDQIHNTNLFRPPESNDLMLLQIPSPTRHSPTSVTLVTQFSLSRLSRFERTLKEWDGPLSITIYLTDSTDILQLESYLLSNPATLERYRSIALTILKPDYSIDEESLIRRLRYPINQLRNLALEIASTMYVVVTDADFVPSPNMHSILRSRGVPLIQQSATALSASSSPTLQQTAIVISAFVLSPLHASSNYPSTTSALSTLYKSSLISLTDPNAGHGPSFPSLLFHSTSPSSLDTWSYEVCFEPQWEPYYLLHRPSHPLYDERFTDQGGDKQSHSILLNALGYNFKVLRDVWFLHPPKTTSEQGGEMDEADQPWPGARLVDSEMVQTEDSDPAHFSKAQRDETRFRYFESFVPEMERTWGGAVNLRWPKGCSAELVGRRSFGRARVEGGGVFGL